MNPADFLRSVADPVCTRALQLDPKGALFGARAEK